MLTHRALNVLAPKIFTSVRGLPESIPGPPPTRALSTAGPLLPWAKDSLGHAGRLFEQYGDVVALVRGGGTRTISTDPTCPGTVLAYGPQHTRTTTAEHEVFAKSILSGSLCPTSGRQGSPIPRRHQPLTTFGSGLFNVNGDEHRRHRRLMMPAFSQRRLAGYAAEMVRQVKVELDTWSLGDVRDLSLDMRRLTLNIVSATLFGTTSAASGFETSRELSRAIRLMGKPLTRILPFDVRGLPFRQFVDSAASLDQETRRLIANKRDSDAAEDMLSALIQARDEESGTQLTEEQLVGHVSVLFTAGHETSSNALTWTLLLLGQFPEVATQLRQELADHLAGGEPTPELLAQMPYLDGVVKESLRLFTPAPYNARILATGAKLGEHWLPAGTEVILSIYHTHRIEPIYPKALTFDPERWATSKPSVYEYNPFSAGPRTCIGAQFALLEIKIALAMLLQRYSLELLPQRIDRFAELVLMPKQPVQVRVRPSSEPCRAVAALSGDIHDMVQLPRV